ncbi:hypothetical protein SNEBB_005280 [Seison nebaliae]|nr:hypothetical protein SNEBB_005280 [Seison nebaliae]
MSRELRRKLSFDQSDFGENIYEGSCSSIIKFVNEKNETLIKKKIRKCYGFGIGERDFLCKLDHKNIIKLLSNYETEDYHHLIFEYYLQSDLWHKLYVYGTFENKVIKSYMLQLLSMIEYLQQNQIIHRDMKPENLLVSSKFDLVLCDFGTAVAFFDNKRLSLPINPQYAPPELIESKNNQQFIDLYSIGCILYYMSTGFVYKLKNNVENNRLGKFMNMMNPNQRALVQLLTEDDSSKRIGVINNEYIDFDLIRRHPFFNNEWEKITDMDIKLLPNIPVALLDESYIPIEKEVIISEKLSEELTILFNPPVSVKRKLMEEQRTKYPEDHIVVGCKLIILQGNLKQCRGYEKRDIRLFLLNSHKLLYKIIEECPTNNLFEINLEKPFTCHLLSHGDIFAIKTKKRIFYFESNESYKWHEYLSTIANL